ncbi:hypothetical protein BDV59DRAFT_176781 [Aspergillus ambiguus]|uniref:uncharacterized protein n=1 Tax=Aspergillus ambiguus TaxID=176160 RepID=UPI003CCCA9E5
MRSGLQKPGAIPLLGLLVFLLLSLVPSLAKEWDLYNLQLRYIGYPRHEVRHLPRVKDASTDIRSRLRSPVAPCKSWTLIDGSCPFNPLSRPRSAVLDTPSRGSFEAASTFDLEINPYTTESSRFTRGVRAVKTFLTKQLDDRPILQPFSTREVPSEGVPARPTSIARNASLLPTAASKEPPLPNPWGSDISETTRANTSLPWVLSFYRASWQQVCRTGSNYFENITRAVPRRMPLAFSFLRPNPAPQSSSDHPTDAVQQSVPKWPALDDDPAVKPTCSPTLHPVAQVVAPKTPNQTVTAAEPSTGLDQRPEHMRGSCMAIVISLVVGVMWF